MGDPIQIYKLSRSPTVANTSEAAELRWSNKKWFYPNEEFLQDKLQESMNIKNYWMFLNFTLKEFYDNRSSILISKSNANSKQQNII